MEQAVDITPGQRLLDRSADSNDRVYAVFNHLVFLLIPCPVVPQLIMWQLKREDAPFLDDHGKEAVNFQISLCLLAAISGLLVVVGIGLLFLLILPWFGIVCTILAAVAAGRGEYFRYPMTLRLIQ